MNIGQKIKELRKTRSMTQEQLAEYLNVSPQAVSKWENETAYPDITLIPRIAAFFEVSTDYLFGINDNVDNERTRAVIAEYNRLCKEGDNEARVVLMREALSEYPHNYDFMNKLARSLYRVSTDTETMDEVISLCKTIILNSRDENIRCSAILTAARAYHEKGMDDKAIEYANRLPSGISSREFYISEFLPKNERKKQLQENIFFLTFNAGKFITYLVSGRRGAGEMFTAAERIQMLETANTLYKAIAYDGNYLTLNGKFMLHCTWIASQYCQLGEYDKAIESLIEAERYAADMDKFLSCGEKVHYTSKLLDCVVANPDGVSKHWTGSHRQKLAAQMSEWEEFNPIRERKEYKELLDRLIS